MRASELLPEAISGPAALLYSVVSGPLGRPAQRSIAAAVYDTLPEDAQLVVDVGCGPGWLAIELAHMRPALQVVAIDLSPTMVRIAGHHAAHLDNVEVRCENAASLSLPDGAADMVVSAESMHHWREPVAVLDELHRVLRTGGRAWIFDGRSDFTGDELRCFTPFGNRAPPAIVGAVMRRILAVHGFSPDDWESHVPELVARSRFRAGRVEPFGPYRRLELVKQPAA